MGMVMVEANARDFEAGAIDLHEAFWCIFYVSRRPGPSVIHYRRGDKSRSGVTLHKYKLWVNS